jgi:hypothetical protein
MTDQPRPSNEQSRPSDEEVRRFVAKLEAFAAELTDREREMLRIALRIGERITPEDVRGQLAFLQPPTGHGAAAEP